MVATVDPPALVASVWRLAAKLSMQYARRFGLDPDDVAQDVAVRLLEKADTFDPDRGSPLTWMKWTTFRAAADHRRRAARRVLVALPDGPDGSPVEFEGRERDPADAVEDAELHALVRDAVADLPERERRVVGLRYRDGLSQVAAGERIGVSGFTVGRDEGRALEVLAGVVGAC